MRPVLPAIVISIILLIAGAPCVSAEVDSDTLGSSPGRFNSIVAADIDDDGAVEIVAGNYEGYLNILEYRGGDFELEWRSEQWGHRLWGIEFLDPDGDGVDELVVGDGDGTVRILDGKTREVELMIDEVGRDAHGLAVGELDGDPNPELFIGTGYKTDQGWGNVQVFDGVTGKKEAELGPFDSRLRGICIADVDMDGTEEIVFGSGVSLGETPGEGYLWVFSYDNASGGYVQEWKSGDLDGCVQGVEVADLNDDGEPEIVASNGYRHREGFVFVFSFSHFEGGDGDNGADGGEGGAKTPVYKKLWQSDDIGPKAYGLAVEDIDGDGHVEIVAGNYAGYVYIFEAPSWRLEWKSNFLGRDVLGLTVADVDGDANLEIVAGQGGYNGKADFTSGYTIPHIYIIDGETHQIEITVGKTDYLRMGLQVAVIILVITFLIGLRLLFRGKKVARKLPLDDRRGVSK